MDKKAQVSLWAAAVAAVATIVAAIITGHQRSPTMSFDISAAGASGAQVNNVQGNSGTAILGSPGATVVLGRQGHTDFVKNNDFHMILGGTYATGKSPPNQRQNVNHMTIVLSNLSIRRIEQVRLAIYPDEEELRSSPIGETQPLTLGSHEVANLTLDTKGAPPDRIRLCLNFAAQNPGDYLIVFVSAARQGAQSGFSMVGVPYKTFLYQYHLEGDFDFYKSDMSGDCALRGHAEKLNVSTADRAW